ncbi:MULTISPECIES: exodeoxyribonuclease VII large subunit [Brachybacterium]|uniref:Exodeoxyribonuclease 7 large subunit n=1 Tax=Brachybacterium alimentarium TaxID=47845 RepID=A0A2A3YFK1_9MICO|nr:MULTISPECIES: exodeoxyribonuclease VII large subunit [Brachybacterium]PCC38064.1 exodeoxyribonuclease VII large subunit [Brachybacterium alimentarium]RCS64552.1 exodeoxyribonuclease VII large subunit [Brachybacterium sp. JB7]RCS74355.1 exodeoxyribonuclease VII large subunit [Brachybacterium alimentarium]RCS75408.1 exodeoxyribonuclease VII large subunit [Brachybacterium alimentarium]RCS75908.1 exodeoxyribonuclease VII large subunit [Brachybacterium alimentarium]
MTETTPEQGTGGAAQPRPAPAATAAQTTAENPWPLRQLSVKVGEYVARMSPLWVEGQIVQLNRRPGAGLSFMTLRDVDVDMSFSVPIREHVLRGLPTEPVAGARVVVHAKPTFWTKRGSLQLEADDIRPVGLGELLAQLEQLKRVLAAEGIFAASRKQELPFMPRVVGLICGRESAAERDVVVNARRRWPAVQFEIREVAVQGTKAVREVSAALRELDDHEEVDVIIISRGGGSLEDLLPFSDEQLTRLVAAATTPIVSAIGHEVDTPLIDLAADVRASTPTDAAKRVVPDIRAEFDQLDLGRTRLRSAIRARLEREQSALDAMRSRPVLENPATILSGRADEIRSRIALARTLVGARLDRAADEADHLARQVRSLSPLATLERGYAVVQASDGTIIRTPESSAEGDQLSVRVAGGRFGVVHVDSDPYTPPTT